MAQDREVCLCFHVTLRKLRNFIRIEHPSHASQMSQCFGAGTGCGWCRPVLKKLFEQASRSQAEKLPTDSADETFSGDIRQSVANHAVDPHGSMIWDDLSVEDYAQRRENHIRQGKGNPPQTP